MYFATLSFAFNSVYVISLYKIKHKSTLLRIEARHLTIDIVESIIVLIGVTLGVYLSALFDLLAALFILGIVVYFIRNSIVEIRDMILDVSPSYEVIEKIRKLILKCKGVKGLHALRAKQIGSIIFIDVHVIVGRNLNIEEAHNIATNIENLLKSEFKSKVDIVIHIEPEGQAFHETPLKA